MDIWYGRKAAQWRKSSIHTYIRWNNEHTNIALHALTALITSNHQLRMKPSGRSIHEQKIILLSIYTLLGIWPNYLTPNCCRGLILGMVVWNHPSCKTCVCMCVYLCMCMCVCVLCVLCVLCVWISKRNSAVVVITNILNLNESTQQENGCHIYEYHATAILLVSTQVTRRNRACLPSCDRHSVIWDKKRHNETKGVCQQKTRYLLRFPLPTDASRILLFTMSVCRYGVVLLCFLLCVRMHAGSNAS